MTISKAKTFRNVIYTTLNKGVSLVCIALTTAVVARNLSPSDYGVVGFAAIIIGFLFHFGDMGVGTAAVRSPALDQNSLSAAFTLKLILSSIAFLAALLIAPYAHHFLEHPAIGNVVRVLALNFLVTTIGFTSLVTLSREQNFRALMVPGMVSNIVNTVLSVILVLLGWKYWAVVFAGLGANLAGCVVLHFARNVPVRLRFDRTDLREYFAFGVPLLGSGILVFLILNMDNFLVGSKMGAAKLGYYAIAFSWGSFSCGLLNDTVNSVMLPAMSAIQDDIAAMRRWYLKTIDMVGFVAVVANTALLANAHFFLATFLGKGTAKWLPAEVALKILCVYGIMRALTEPLSNCIMARGRTRILLRATTITGAAELLLIVLVLRTGRIELVAAAVLIAYATLSIVYVPYLQTEFSIGIGDLVSQLWPIVPAFAVGYAATSVLPESFGGTLFTLGCRGLFTASAVAVTHGLCTHFRCFQEAGGMIWQNFVRARIEA